MGDRPHILIFMVDQLSALYLRAYGHAATHTPTIDRLAEGGVVFENAYMPSPLCAPSRAAFMTGMLPTRTGVNDNSAGFASSIPTFAHYLRLEGYRTCLSGKMHFVGPDQLHGFEERLTTDVYPCDFGWTPDWSRPGERVDWFDLPAAPGLPVEERDPHGRRLWQDCAMGGVEITEEDVRAARHGYYASLSYVDEKIGEILEARSACGLADDTVVIQPVDGRSLVPLLEGASESPDATVVGEYLAESVLAPMVMIRRGRWKLIHTPSDPDQLFDPEGDPLELVNLAAAPEHAAALQELRDEVASRWDLDAVERDVRESEQARLAVFRALQLGARHPWDFQPARAASEQYTRNNMDAAERDQQSRYPPLSAS